MVLVAALFVFGLNDSVLAAFFSESLPTRTRYLGFALPFNVGAVLFGGVAPYIGTWLISVTGNPYSPAFFVMGVAALSLVGVLLMKERTRRDMPTESIVLAEAHSH